MRRRFRLAAVPVHRHALPQVALDAVLVALAYHLAYALRFDGAGGVPPDYEELRANTLPFVIGGNLVVFTAFGMYRHWLRYTQSSDYLRIVQAVLVAVLALVGFVAVDQPKLNFADGRFFPVNVPTGVLVLYGLLMLGLLIGSRTVVHLFFERRPRGFRPQRGARSVLIVGAGEGGRLLL